MFGCHLHHSGMKHHTCDGWNQVGVNKEKKEEALILSLEDPNTRGGHRVTNAPSTKSLIFQVGAEPFQCMWGPDVVFLFRG